ncbi:uncharacterized protein LOC126315424 [Schistocerca gregaria]|uniref:uncharacterized protein LOC126315424 n=1 Tax=Schistocerca gregaria TaxID=7010 RepID=UPI00211EB810|nr:uncharacterized protein LOC126315424 [Schistocerca gregaria]XP_049848632.1 uncharacterized protein LOC126315424 [Schistocerca gregaria]XP_049848633.1 uncharacterized protein LOC126315424 [Schistocerca gregaria]
MSSSSSASPWIREVLECWYSGKIKKCCKILSKKSSLQFCLSSEAAEPGDEIPFHAGPSEPDRRSKFKYHFAFPSSDNNAVNACNTHNSGCCLLTELIRVNDYATLHNLLIIFNVLFGIVLDIESLQKTVECDFVKKNSGQPGNDFTEFEPNASKRSLLAPSAYPIWSVERQLANLGRYLPIAWYNLVLYHFLSGSYRLSLQISEELIDYILSNSDRFSSTGLTIAFLYITLVIKLNTYSPKLELVVSEIEAQLPKQVNSQAYVRWLRLIKAHIFSVQNRLQASRNELEAVAQPLTFCNDQFEGELHPTESPLITGKCFLDAEASGIASFNDCLTLFLKSRLFDLEQNFSRAESELSKVVLNSSNAVPYYNNLGVIACHQKRYAAASIYFHKAFQETQKVSAQTPSKSHTKPFINQHLIGIVIYNLGLQMHMLCKYEEAFELFKQSLKFDSLSSYLRGMTFLRLSEATIQIYLAEKCPAAQAYTIPEICRTGGRTRVFNSIPRSSKTDKLLRSSTYYLNTAFILLQSLCLLRDKKTTVQPDRLPNVGLLNSPSDDFTPSIERLRFVCIYCQALLSWIFLEAESFEKARQCALQALKLKELYFLAQKSEPQKNQTTTSEKIVAQPTTSTSSDERLTSQLSPNHLCDSPQIDCLSFSIYVYLAESELRLGNLNSALDILQSIPKRTDVHISIGFDVQRISCSQKVSLYCSLACIYIVKGDEAQALRLIDKSISLAPGFPAAIALKVYLDIKNGQIDSAIQLLCNYRVRQLIHVHTDK